MVKFEFGDAAGETREGEPTMSSHPNVQKLVIDGIASP